MPNIDYGAFQPTAFTSAFQLAMAYAEERDKMIGGRPDRAFLVPFGPIYSDEKMVIVRAKIGNAEKTTETTYQYLAKNDQPARPRSVQFRVAEQWLNTAEPVVKAKRIEHVED